MSRRLADVSSITVHLLPVTRCEPPEGICCRLGPTNDLTAVDAKNHALEHPGHVVVREVVARTRYVYFEEGG